ncbi:protein DDI1 homolog 2 [Hydra vulgaris]|uniref:Protein DDI1 homolog 2 n=1 Tax=Hydra vulgaris TaxID=6087 RepID=A0ABM4C1P7_HYDVU
MLITVTCASTDVVYSLEVSPEIELENFKVLVQVESGSIGMTDMVFFHNGKLLIEDKKSLAELGVQNNDVLLFGPLPHGSITNASSPPRTGRPVSSVHAGAGIDWGSVHVPSTSHTRTQQHSRQRIDSNNPEVIRTMFLSDPHQMSLLKERNPRLAEVINSPIDFEKVFEEQRVERLQIERERIQLLAADPFDPEAQAKIAEEIRMETVNQNMHTAMEHAPEVFAEVYMLYINVLINGHQVKAFVDSGAQMTIMSKSCAERCNFMRLVDHRWQGMAIGVGQQKIIGRIHMGQIQIEKDFLSTSFTILENQPMDVLLGLDMLKRHQCCIDLKKNALIIGTTNTETRFLNESELPDCARLNRKRVHQSTESFQEEEDRLLAEALIKSQSDAKS